MRVQHQRLAPAVESRYDARLRPEIAGIAEQRKQGVTDRRKQQRGHQRHIVEPQRIEVMGDSKDHMVMITAQQPGLLGR
jgi:hypothetical protein